MGFRGLKMASMWLMLGPLGPDMAPRWRQDGSRERQDGPKMAPRGRPEGSQRSRANWGHLFFCKLASKTPQEGLQSAPGVPQEGPRGPQEGLKGPKRAPIGPQLGPKRVTKHYTRPDNTTHDTPRRPSNRLFRNSNSNLNHVEAAKIFVATIGTATAEGQHI